MQVALWSQKNAARCGAPVVWDYHVVLAVRRRVRGISEADESAPGPTGVSADHDAPEASRNAGLGPCLNEASSRSEPHFAADVDDAQDSLAWIYDFDSALPSPCPALGESCSCFCTRDAGATPALTCPNLRVRHASQSTSRGRGPSSFAHSTEGVLP
jgi:hypothetical protein